MNKVEQFTELIKNEFPDDRLTFQKTLPTFHPENAGEAAGLFKLANREQQKIYITGFGNNIDPVGDRFADLIVVRNDRLNQLLEIAPQDFYVKVGSGYPLRELNQHLAKHKLWMPHASLAYVGSIGGALAAGLSTELNGHDLPLKKYFIAAEIVTPTGEIITPGSSCFKSVSGYDVIKIFARSWGLLGFIVSATFRVMPESAAGEFAGMKLKEFDRRRFLEGLAEVSTETDAVYCRKIKAKFDPRNILPII